MRWNGGKHFAQVGKSLYPKAVLLRDVVSLQMVASVVEVFGASCECS